MHHSLRNIRLLRYLRTGWRLNRQEKAFSRFLERGHWRVSNMNEKQVVGVVVQPWVMSAVPWYAITLALALSEMGQKVKIIWDDTSFGIDNYLQQLQQKSIGRILAKLPSSIQSTQLSKISPLTTSPISPEELRYLVDLNVVWRFRGETLPNDADTYRLAVEQSLCATSKYIGRFLSQSDLEYLIIPGGIYGSSGLFMKLGQKSGVRIASFDSGRGAILVSTDGIAAHLNDIARAFQLLPPEDSTSIIAKAQEEIQRVMSGQDRLSYQSVTSNNTESPFDILLPLNLSYDTAALGRHRVFKNQIEWMLETVAWVLERSSETIVVRQHPVERKPNIAGKDDYGELLISRFGKHPRIRFVAADSPVNTYDLLAQARVVVPYVSTVGIEAAALGKPVVTEGISYYADLGFVWNAQSREEYFGLLGQALDGQLLVTQEKINAAWRCYYLAQCYRLLWTEFTPMPQDFDKWVRMSPNELFAMPEVKDIVEAIDKNIPLATLRHNRHKKQRQSTKQQV